MEMDPQRSCELAPLGPANDDARSSPAHGRAGRFDLLPTPTVLLSETGMILDGNLAWRRDSALGATQITGGVHRAYSDVLRGAWAAAAVALVQRALRGGGDGAVTLSCEGDTERWISVEVTRMADGTLLVEHRDHTEAHRAQRRSLIEARLRATPEPSRAPDVLRWLCGALGCEVASVWRACPAQPTLTLDAVVVPGREVRRAWSAVQAREGAVLAAMKGGRAAWSTAIGRGELTMLRECLRARAREIDTVFALPSEQGVVAFHGVGVRRVEPALEALLTAYLGAVPAPVRRAAAPLRDTQTLLALATRSEAPVLLVGAAYSGKSTHAREIHRGGRRAEGPLVIAPTGGVAALAGEERRRGETFEARPGVLARAQRATLLIESLEAMDLEAQRWLGAAMTEGCWAPLGSSEPRPFTARVIACSRRSLDALRASPDIDPALLERLSALPIALPRLRDRRAELPEITEKMLSVIASAWGAPAPTLSADALRAIVAAPWEGELRALRRVLERAWVGMERELSGAAIEAALSEAREPRCAGAEPEVDDARLEVSERAHVERVLRQTAFRMSAAARILGISRSTLYARVRGWKLDLDAMRAAAS